MGMLPLGNGQWGQYPSTISAYRYFGGAMEAGNVRSNWTRPGHAIPIIGNLYDRSKEYAVTNIASLPIAGRMVMAVYGSLNVHPSIAAETDTSNCTMCHHR